MRRVTGAVVLGLSACGYPLTQLVIRRWGRRGAATAECVCAGLAIRDASMVASGVPGRLRRAPAVLLFLELGAGVAACLAGLPPLLSAQPADDAAAAKIDAADSVRRTAVAALFAIHTIRFGIYLRPDQGRRPEQACCYLRVSALTGCPVRLVRRRLGYQRVAWVSGGRLGMIFSYRTGSGFLLPRVLALVSRETRRALCADPPVSPQRP